MLKRRRITIGQAQVAVALYQDIPIRFVDIELAATLEIANQLSIYAYDAYLIRTAEKYRAPLLTLDKALQHHARSYGVKIRRGNPMSTIVTYSEARQNLASLLDKVLIEGAVSHQTPRWTSVCHQDR